MPSGERKQGLEEEDQAGPSLGCRDSVHASSLGICYVPDTILGCETQHQTDLARVLDNLPF